MANFLDIDESLLARNLLIGGNPTAPEQGTGLIPSVNEPHILLTPSERQEQSQCKFIIPQPGLCIKTREVVTNHKVFVNLCKSDDVPEPDEYFTDEQLGNLLSRGTDDEVNEVRIPMSIGEKHLEKDKTGTTCPVLDVVINSVFFDSKILTSELYRTFIIVVSLEGLEEKFKMELDKNGYTVLQHKKSMGKLNPHLVKTKPRIKEVKPGKDVEVGLKKVEIAKEEGRRKSLVEEIDTKEHELEYKITQMSRDMAKAEVKLPGLKNAKKLAVTIGADRIMVDSPVGQLDVFVPLDIHQEESKAEYDVATKTLQLQLPLVVKP